MLFALIFLSKFKQAAARSLCDSWVSCYIWWRSLKFGLNFWLQLTLMQTDFQTKQHVRNLIKRALVIGPNRCWIWYSSVLPSLRNRGLLGPHENCPGNSVKWSVTQLCIAQWYSNLICLCIILPLAGGHRILIIHFQSDPRWWIGGIIAH